MIPPRIGPRLNVKHKIQKFAAPLKLKLFVDGSPEAGMEQTITPVEANVFVGGLSGAEDEELLQQLGITHILTVDIHLPRISTNRVRQVCREHFQKIIFLSQL